MLPSWTNNNRLHIFVFAVKRGLAVFIRLPNNVGVIYDLGGGESFSPVEFIDEKIIGHLTQYDGHNIAQLLVSHPHADHIQQASEINCRSPRLRPALVTLPHDVGSNTTADERVDFTRIENGDNEELISEYKKLYDNRKPPLRTIDPETLSDRTEDLEYGFYYMRPPKVAIEQPNNDHHYGNGLSFCLWLRYGKHSVWIPGDITPEVHKKVIHGADSVERRIVGHDVDGHQYPHRYHTETKDQPSPNELFRKNGLSVLVAPHHGLESCFPDVLFDSLPDGRVRAAIVSEKRHTGASDGTVDSRYLSSDYVDGVSVDKEGAHIKLRRVSTASDHHILISLDRNKRDPTIVMRKDALELLASAQ